MGEENKLTPETKRPMGRPRLTFDLRQVEELGKIQSTQPEVAAVLGCGLSTVKDRLANDAAFSAAYKRGLEIGKSSLRRLQWKSALAGSVVMQIWLGKQYLDQRDQPVPEMDRSQTGLQLSDLARTAKGRDAIMGITAQMAKAYAVLREQSEGIVDAEVRELPSLPEISPPSER